MAKKPKRVVDRKLLDTYHDMDCEICGRPSCDPSHIKSKGSGGDDDPENLIALCNGHHREQHRFGWIHMIRKYPIIDITLSSKGFYIDPYNRLKKPAKAL